MMNHKKLIERLENAAEWITAHGRDTNTAVGKLCEEAAAAITALTEENARLRVEIDWIQSYNSDAEKVIATVGAELEQVKREKDAAMAAVDRMAQYIVTLGRVDYFLCDDIPKELHLKHQPKNDGNYENGPCIECVKEYYLRGPQKKGD